MKPQFSFVDVNGVNMFGEEQMIVKNVIISRGRATFNIWVNQAKNQIKQMVKISVRY